MRDRLASAYISLSMLEPNQVPDELRPRVERLMNELRQRRKFRAHGDPRGVQIASHAPKSGQLARAILDIFVALEGGL
jgi:hypothetical protein